MRSPTADPKARTLTLREAAAVLGVSVETVRVRVHEGRIPRELVIDLSEPGARKKLLRFRALAFRAWVDGRVA